MTTAHQTIPPQWAWHYRALGRIRDELLLKHEDHTQLIRTVREQGGEDTVDVANQQLASTTLLAEIRFEEAELAEVNAALQRIRDGNYGICEITGRPISAARLRAIPWTRLSHRAALECGPGYRGVPSAPLK
jgi:RNA polymerase-binding transcription factor DksA